MKQFKKSSTCTLDSRNYIYLAHFSFKIVSLDTDEVLYEEEHPFPERKRKMQIINVAVNDDLVIIMNYKCDFALYKYLPKLRKFQKIWTYYQRHNNIERLDVSNYWNVNNGFAFCMNDLKKPNATFIRHILPDGSIKDYYYPIKACGFIDKYAIPIALRDIDDNMYIFNKNFTSEKDILIKRDDLNDVLKYNSPKGYFLSFIKIKNEEYGFFEENENTISFKKYENGEWYSVDKKSICLDSYFLFTKGKQFGLIEYETDYCTYFQLKYNFNNVIKCINSNNNLEIIHLNDANEKYICFCSSLSRASVIVFSIDELEDFVDESILE